MSYPDAEFRFVTEDGDFNTDAAWEDRILDAEGIDIFDAEDIDIVPTPDDAIPF